MLRVETIPKDLDYKVCQKCITSGRIDGGKVVNLLELHNDDQRQIMDNWPLFDPKSQKTIQDTLTDIEKNTSSFYKDVYTSIENYFGQLQTCVSETIAEQKKAMLIEAEKYKEFDQDVLNVYNGLSKRKELKAHVDSLPNTLGDLETFLREMDAKRNKNTIEIDKAITEYNLKKSLFCKKQPDLLQKYLLKLIKKINFYSPSESYLYESGKLQMDLEEEGSNMQANNHNGEQNYLKVKQLIANQSNFCSSKFLNQMETYLRSTQDQLARIVDFNSVHMEHRKKPIDFSKVSLSSLQDIVEERAEERANDQTLEFSRRLEETFLRNRFINAKIIEGFNGNFFQVRDENEQQGQNPSAQIVTQNSSILIKKIQKGNATIITNYNIKHEFMHIFRYKVYQRMQDNHYIYAGLIKETNIGNQRIKNENLYQGSFLEHKFTNIQGNQGDPLKLKDIKTKYDIFEMRVHLAKNQIQVMDYPGYHNITTINNFEVNKSDNYRFGFEFSKDSDGDIIEFLYFDILYQN